MSKDGGHLFRLKLCIRSWLPRQLGVPEAGEWRGMLSCTADGPLQTQAPTSLLLSSAKSLFWVAIIRGTSSTLHFLPGQPTASDWKLMQGCKGQIPAPRFRESPESRLAWGSLMSRVCLLQAYPSLTASPSGSCFLYCPTDVTSEAQPSSPLSLNLCQSLFPEESDFRARRGTSVDVCLFGPHLLQ